MSIPLAARELVLAYDGPVIVDGITLNLASGSLTALIGPNGCGKSTLLRALARVLPPRSGAVLVDNLSIRELATREVARRLSFLPQSPATPSGLRVRELVAYGRFPYRRILGGSGSDDRAAIEQALVDTGLTGLQERELDTLSGGQRQRAWIAMALCQGAATLLLDEPTSHLDLAHQIEVLAVLRRLADRGRTIVVVLHDLQLAARHADRLIALADGRIAAQGTPIEVVVPEVLRRVFGIEAEVIADPQTGRPLCLPRGLASGR